MSTKLVLRLAFSSCILTFIFSICVGIITKKSYVDNLDQRKYMIDDYIIHRIVAIDEEYYCGDITEISDIEDISDTIVKVRIDSNNDRIYKKNNTLTLADIVEVYKGDIDTESIYIIEPIYYFQAGDCIMCYEGYYWMYDEDEYILFLNKQKDPNLCEHDDVFVLTTTNYSKYNITTDTKTDNSQKYSTIYNELYKSVLEKYR